MLDVISRSAFDLHAVFETVAESSVRLCGADRAFIFRFDSELLRMAVAYNTSPEFTEFVSEIQFAPAGTACRPRRARTPNNPHSRCLGRSEYTFGAKDFRQNPHNSRGADTQRR